MAGYQRENKLNEFRDSIDSILKEYTPEKPTVLSKIEHEIKHFSNIFRNSQSDIGYLYKGFDHLQGQLKTKGIINEVNEGYTLVEKLAEAENFKIYLIILYGASSPDNPTVFKFLDTSPENYVKRKLKLLEGLVKEKELPYEAVKFHLDEIAKINRKYNLKEPKKYAPELAFDPLPEIQQFGRIVLEYLANQERKVLVGNRQDWKYSFMVKSAVDKIKPLAELYSLDPKPYLRLLKVKK